VKALLKDFFENYTGTLIWHNSPYDTKVLIYELWMEHLLDTEGLLVGLHLMHKKLQDTKIITYLATNTTAGNSLALKDLGHEFAGAYGMGDNIKDIRRIPLPQLLEYNLTDGLCTWFVFDKYYPIMVEDQQEDLYYDLMLPSQKVITQIELSGMPLNPEQVQVARQKLEHIVQQEQAKFVNLPLIKRLEDKLTNMAFKKDFEDRKAKAKHPDKILPKNRATFPQFEFNPGSGPQLQILLYEEMGLPVVDKTKTKLPATGGKTLEKLANHTTDPVYLELMQALINHAHADKILTTFIPAFEKAIDKGETIVYLHGSFNLGGTKSGRLSSSDPNLQNIPSGSVYGKLIKSCFEAPVGWLFAGADFRSLEDYVSALTTKDPNKLKVYTDGYDGHCLRAFSYFPERLPGIVNTVESINSIEHKFKDIRQLSKTPTFALTYQGTFITLMKNLGFDEATAKQIERNYHELYQVSDAWVQAKLDEASRTGYVTLAFGLRLRTPLLGQTLRGKRSTPYEAQAEGRTAGNALGQSYGLLTNRSMNAFMDRVWNSRYRYDIKPVAMIHDANYILIKDNIEVVEWVNNELIKAMEWHNLPELYHPTVKIGAALDVFYPNWASPCTLTNYADKKEIRATCAAFLEKLADKQKEAA
jgi:DNA polymerase-1